MEPIEVEEGQAYVIKPGDFVREECCECGLCHMTRYDVRDGLIYATTHLDPYGTRRAREKRRKP